MNYCDILYSKFINNYFYHFENGAIDEKRLVNDIEYLAMYKICTDMAYSIAYEIFLYCEKFGYKEKDAIRIKSCLNILFNKCIILTDFYIFNKCYYIILCICKSIVYPKDLMTYLIDSVNSYNKINILYYNHAQ